MVSLILLGAGANITLGRFAGLLAAEFRSSSSVWHLDVSSSTFSVVVLAKCEELRCVDFPGDILQGKAAQKFSKLSAHRARHSTKQGPLL
jgi:hypothetical protein